MARWEIRLLDQPPMVCETDRELDADWLRFVAKRKRTLKDRQWHAAPGVVVDCRIVVGVQRKPPRPAEMRRALGFTTGEPA